MSLRHYLNPPNQFTPPHGRIAYDRLFPNFAPITPHLEPVHC